MNIEYKSTGQLIDELFTTAIKIENGIEGSSKRYEDLKIAILGRVKNDIYFLSSSTLQKLEEVLRCCWVAQEIVMEHSLGEGNVNFEIARSAKEAQALNAERSHLIRTIDECLGEINTTTLKKSYA